MNDKMTSKSLRIQRLKHREKESGGLVSHPSTPSGAK